MARGVRSPSTRREGVVVLVGLWADIVVWRGVVTLIVFVVGI